MLSITRYRNTRYSLLFDAGEFRQAASVYAELLAAEAQGCQERFRSCLFIGNGEKKRFWLR